MNQLNMYLKNAESNDKKEKKTLKNNENIIHTIYFGDTRISARIFPMMHFITFLLPHVFIIFPNL